MEKNFNSISMNIFYYISDTFIFQSLKVTISVAQISKTRTVGLGVSRDATHF